MAPALGVYDNGSEDNRTVAALGKTKSGKQLKVRSLVRTRHTLDNSSDIEPVIQNSRLLKRSDCIANSTWQRHSAFLLSEALMKA